MKRREFITLLGGAAVAWPFAAKSQQPAVPLIGFLRSTTLEGTTHLVTAFRQGLREAGYIEGQNVTIEYRSAEDHYERLPALVNDLIRRQVAVIFGNVVSAAAAKTITTTVPIVFATGSDPVRDGLVTSLNRPGGNVTGASFFAAEVGAKRLDLLRQLVPSAPLIAVLLGPDSSDIAAERRDIEEAAQAIRQNLVILSAATPGDIDTVFATIVERRATALLVGSGAFTTTHRQRIAALAAQHSLPAIYSVREFATAGGLMSYGGSITDAYRQAAGYVGRILKGEKPSDLPIVRSTKLEFLINLKTAKTLGIEFHPQLLATADEVIE